MNQNTTTTEPARLLDVVAVAALLGVSSRHVYRLADGGRMPRPLKLGGARRWDRAAIDDWRSIARPVGATITGADPLPGQIGATSRR